MTFRDPHERRSLSDGGSFFPITLRRPQGGSWGEGSRGGTSPTSRTPSWAQKPLSKLSTGSAPALAALARIMWSASASPSPG